MHKTKNFLPTFLILLAFTILLIILSKSGLLNVVTSFFERGTVPIQRLVFGVLTNHDLSSSSEMLRVENSKLISELVKQKELVKENQALRDQFQKSNPSPRKLIPSRVIGQKIDKIIIDKGFDDGVEKGDVVIFKDNLIGRISKSSARISIVDLPINKSMFFTAKILDSSTQGVVKGNENGIVLDNVILSEKIKNGDIVVTKGDIDEKEKGFPPNLVIGKIISFNKKASSLFQTAEIKSLVDFSKTETVFVISR